MCKRAVQSGLSICLLILGGCTASRVTVPANYADPHGLIIMLPGIEGRPWQLFFAHSALRDAGATAKIDIKNWARLDGSLHNLTDIERNQATAAGIADEITEYAGQHPGEPIDLIGYSGGGGLVVLAAEKLPADVKLRYLILVQPALSPDHDLSVALDHVCCKLINFYCPSDWIILGFGTKQFGTIDRVYTEAAGKVGFNIENAVPRIADRERFAQEAWKLDDFWTGHIGNHIGMGTYGWNRKHIAPLLAPNP